MKSRSRKRGYSFVLIFYFTILTSLSLALDPVTLGSEQSRFSIQKEEYYGIWVSNNLFVNFESLENLEKHNIKFVNGYGQIQYATESLYIVENSYIKDGAAYTCECKLEPDYATRYSRYFERSSQPTTFIKRDIEIDTFQMFIRKYIPGEEGVTLAQSQKYNMKDTSSADAIKYSLDSVDFGIYDTKAIIVFDKLTDKSTVGLNFIKLPLVSYESAKTSILPNAFTGKYQLHFRFRNDGIYFYDGMNDNHLQGKGLYRFDIETEELAKIWDPKVITDFDIQALFGIDFDNARIAYLTFADPNNPIDMIFYLNIASLKDGNKIMEPELLPKDIHPISLSLERNIIKIRARNRDIQKYGLKSFWIVLTMKSNP